MATQKALRFIYSAKNGTTGLTDIKAQIYVNGVSKAIGANAIKNTANANGSKVTEIDATNSPGLYEVLITAVDLTAFGVAAGSYSAVEAYIDSTSKSAPAIFRGEETVANIDDIDTKLGTPAGASVSADIAANYARMGAPAGASVSADVASVKSDTAAIKTDLESGAASLATILSNIQALQNGSIGNGVGFVLPSMLIPASGTNTYRIPITINNNDGALIDPVSNTVTVGVLNASGTDRGAYLTGSAGGPPLTVAATRDSVGQYHAMVVLPTSAVEEELIFSFAYTVGSNSMIRYGQAQLLTDMAASGFALQSTLLTVQTAVNAIKADVENVTTGLIPIEGFLANGTYGLAALQALLANGTYGLSAIEALLADGTIGLGALKNYLANGTYGLSALQVQGAASQGAGFVTGTDSLHAISAFLTANIYTGGTAI
jgi:hypothetical protein